MKVARTVREGAVGKGPASRAPRRRPTSPGIHAPAADVTLAGAHSSPAGHLLLFGLLPVRPAAALPASVATDETTGWHVLRGPEELAFPLHTRAAQEWFRGGYA